MNANTLVQQIKSMSDHALYEYLKKSYKNVAPTIIIDNVPILNFLVSKLYHMSVKYLLDKGANVNSEDNGVPVLYQACVSGDIEMIKLLLKYNPSLLSIVDGKSIIQHAVDKKFSKEVCKIIIDKFYSTKYSGVTKSQIKAFDIFLAIPDYSKLPQLPIIPANREPTEEEQLQIDNYNKDKKIEDDSAYNILKNTSMCPVCLAYTFRTDGCLYMSHECKPSERHEKLYKKYRSGEGKIWWCTDCGRIGLGHKHYKIGYSDGDIPQIAKYIETTEQLFDKECISNGGGGTKEKLSRISRMIDFYADLQTTLNSGKNIGSNEDIRNMIIEETWNGAMLKTIINPIIVKRWKTDLNVFPNTLNISNNSYNKLPLVIQEGSYQQPVLHQNVYNPIEMDECDAIQFIHRDRNLKMNNHIYTDKNHPNNRTKDETVFICRKDLLRYVKDRSNNGKCFDTRCNGYLYPDEIKMAFQLYSPAIPFTDEEKMILQKYNDVFPKKRNDFVFKGGNYKLPDINTIFKPMTNGECSIKKSVSGGGGTRGRRTGKRRMRLRKTYKKHQIKSHTYKKYNKHCTRRRRF